MVICINVKTLHHKTQHPFLIQNRQTNQPTCGLGVVVCACNPSIVGGRGRQSSSSKLPLATEEFEASLVYMRRFLKEKCKCGEIAQQLSGVRVGI